ncbi:MAG: glycoside hydrolase family 125 protein, partial [Candidatus Obscuribacterales bacterium]|nr:glycoside hydrolase family 125 protein [Candidatus Obscuribacterales bacterium]
EPDDTIYVQTGDIPAEWLRDSSAQVRPYLYFAKSDAKVRDYLRKVIARQAAYILIDPYANAFKENNEVWERKYELDSLCYPIILAWTYWQVTGDSAIFTPKFEEAMKKAVGVMVLEQDHAANSNFTHPEIAEKGRDTPVANGTGMSWSGFRPSDDACKYHFLIPSEMMAVVALRGLEQIEKSVYKNQAFANQVNKLKKEIDEGVRRYGIVETKEFGKVFAFEVDGLGHYTLEDDANIPSLLSVPYLGYVWSSYPVYQNTRKLILSKANKNYASGSIASGIGSEHTPEGYVWPLAMVMQALTENEPKAQDQILKEILASDPGDHLLHESFNPNKQTEFTRPDFGWPNALFAELVMQKLQHKKPLPVPANSR